MRTRQVLLGDIADTCLGKMLDQHKNKGEFQPYLANINVRWGEFDLADLPQMRFMETEQERYGLRYGDILVCEGGEPGRCAIWKEQIPNMKFQKALHRVRVHEDVVDFQWLFYRFLLARSRREFDQYFSGTTTIKHMPGDKLIKIRLDLPDLIVQKRIGEVLSAYDALIETNQRQIKLLEEAAQRLYREWFVDLRFPGHEDVPVVDGVPEGWSEKALGEAFTTVLGGTPSRNNPNYWGGRINWINSGEINNLRIIKRSEGITELGLANSSTKQMPLHATVLAITGATLGQVSYTEIETCANQSVVGIIDESKEYSMYIYLYVCDKITHMIGKATGGAQQHINKDIVNAYPIILPPHSIIGLFNSAMQPLFDKLATLLFENESLAEARDRFLPKLMSGEISV